MLDRSLKLFEMRALNVWAIMVKRTLQKHEAHTYWRKGHVQAIVATKAFGMGINKPDIAIVNFNVKCNNFPHFPEGLLYRLSHYWAVLKHRYFRPCRLAGTCRQKPELIGGEAVHKLQLKASTRSVWREPKATVPCYNVCSMNKCWFSDHRREFEIAADHLGCYGEVTSLDFR